MSEAAAVMVSDNGRGSVQWRTNYQAVVKRREELAHMGPSPQLAASLRLFSSQQSGPKLSDDEIAEIMSGAPVSALEERRPGPAERPQWQWSSLADALKPQEPTQYVIDGLFSAGSLSIIYGAPGALKTMLMLDAAICVAGGLPWLRPASGGVGGLATMGGPVLWVDLENGGRVMALRIAAAARGHGLGQDAPFHYVSLPNPPFDAGEQSSIDDIFYPAHNLGARLIVVDNLGVARGAADENSGDMARILAGLRMLAERTGAAVVLLHHPRKGGAGDGRPGDALRGHSSIEAALDLALHVVRESGQGVVTLTPTKVRGAPVSVLAAEFRYSQDDSGDLVESVFVGKPLSDHYNEVRALVLDILSDGPLSTRKLEAAVKDSLPAGCSRDRARLIVGELVKGGQIAQSEGRYGAKLLSLPGADVGF